MPCVSVTAVQGLVETLELLRSQDVIQDNKAKTEKRSPVAKNQRVKFIASGHHPGCNSTLSSRKQSGRLKLQVAANCYAETLQLIGLALSHLWIDMDANLTDATGAGASSVRGEVNLYDQFGSVLLLQGLYDLWPNWYLWETWGNHKFKVQCVKFLPISRVPATRVEGAEDKSVHRLRSFLSTVENELVPYLQSESDLASSFQNYLRKPHKSWKDFFEMILKVSESDLCFVGEHVKREFCEDFGSLVKALLKIKPPQAPEDTDSHTHIGKYTGQR